MDIKEAIERLLDHLEDKHIHFDTRDKQALRVLLKFVKEKTRHSYTGRKLDAGDGETQDSCSQYQHL